MTAASTIAASPRPRVLAGLRAMDRDFVCPEKLPDASARFEAMKQFMARHEAIVPKASVNERMAYYDRLMAKHGCAEPTEQYTFPQS